MGYSVIHVDKIEPAGPGGAVVTYTASATDDVDGSVPVTCVPASGSTFEIGTTPVTCSAEDAAGNEASAGFDVHVRGADEQVDELIAVVVGIGPGTSLRDKLEDVRSALAESDVDAACGQLNAFGNQVRTLSGRTIGAEQADELITAADRIRAVLDC